MYKNCGNTSLTTDVTFFTFPSKDKQKSESWAKLAGYSGDSLKYKYLCEHHFSSIYISRTPRRTILLPPAMPYYWNDQDKSYEAEMNVTCDESSSDQHEKTDDEEIVDHIQVADEMSNDFDIASDTIHAQIVTFDPINISTNKIHQYDNPKLSLTKVVTDTNDDQFIDRKPDVLCHVTKRQKLHATTGNSNAEISSKSIENHELFEDVVPNHIDYTENNPDITTFIYKGEEYIQMPKRIYLQQRTQLDTEIRRYELFIHSIKSLVQSLENNETN